jgi:DNA-binding transcriptional ArsR family regulator
MRGLVMRETVAIARALSDPGRVRILLALRGRELCVCQIVEFLGLAPSTVSKHMAVLRGAYLVENRRDGRWAYYRRAGHDAPSSVHAALRWLDGALAEDPRTGHDAERIDQILKIPVEELCRPIDVD